MDFTPKEIIANDNHLIIANEFECNIISYIDNNAIAVSRIVFSRLYSPDDREWENFCRQCIHQKIDDYLLKDDYVLLINEERFNKIEYLISQSCGNTYTETLKLIKGDVNNG